MEVMPLVSHELFKLRFRRLQRGGREELCSDCNTESTQSAVLLMSFTANLFVFTVKNNNMITVWRGDKSSCLLA
jgi:hypothetical protein